MFPLELCFVSSRLLTKIGGMADRFFFLLFPCQGKHLSFFKPEHAGIWLVKIMHNCRRASGLQHSERGIIHVVTRRAREISSGVFVKSLWFFVTGF